jgi:hypothetical protein
MTTAASGRANEAAGTAAQWMGWDRIGVRVWPSIDEGATVMDAGMWSNVVTSVIAVAGTLGGVVLTTLAQARASRAERRESRTQARRGEAVAAVTALVSALADHRRAMFVLEDRRLAGADSHVVDDAVATSHETRSAVTDPLVTVRLLAPALAETAQQAARAAYAMRRAPDPDALQARRAAALAASDRLVDEASVVFADLAVIA